MNFSDFSFHPNLFEGIRAMHFEQATPIQDKAIPIIIEGKDLIACAQTGTGKTAAYLLPVIHKILEQRINGTTMLVIAPTRELAQQIDQQVEALAYFTGVSSIALYGGGDGAAWDQQKKAIQQGVEIIIATPGRLIALLTSAQINLKNIKHLVLDEADRMLDMGFNDDIMRIVSYLPENRQTLLFSATMPPKIRTLAKTILKTPFEINIAISKPAEGILQQAYLVYDSQKVALATHLLKNKQYNSIIIFASTKEKVKELDRTLKREGIPCHAFHSDLEQPEREELMRQFKNKKISTLVATDVISRGIDVVGIDLVINFDVPPDPEDYIHRIGRTARAESTGTAITFVNEADQPKFFRIENLIGKDISKIPTPEHIGSSPIYQPELRRKTNFRNDKFKKKFRKK
ncbi:MAG: DEAD/DEAH box helicase [Flavobacteriales bacterium]|nr:DEAD/DEAH box helicase [Flavobacteriales bacterium]